MIAQFTAKITNSEKAIYFLSLMPCSINTLSSLICSSHVKISCFPILRGKKYFVPGNSRVAGAPLAPFPYGPDLRPVSRGLMYQMRFHKFLEKK